MKPLLPGGLVRDGQIHREASLRPIDGHIELAAAAVHRSRPDFVTNVLTAAVDRVGTVECTEGAAEQLSVGDRAYLMIQIGVAYSGDGVWLSPTCTTCGHRFDVFVRPSELAVRRTQALGFPTTSCEIGGYRLTVRTPTGGDQRWLVETRPVEPVKALLSRCVVEINGPADTSTVIDALSPREVRLLDDAIAGAGPHVDCELRARCATCGNIDDLEFDVCWFVGSADTLDADTHWLASRYRWSYTDILGLSRRRRQRLVAMIHAEAAP